MEERAEMSMIEMPQYKCHKRVWALKIDGVVSNPNGSVDLFFVEKGYAPVNLEGKSADREWRAGGYYVVYEDGYTSFSPAKAFEEGYTLADKEEPERCPSCGSSRIAPCPNPWHQDTGEA